MDAASKPYILVVDDEKGFVEFVRALLVDRGYEVGTASDGAEGLEALARRLRPWTPEPLCVHPQALLAEWRVRRSARGA